MKQEILQDALSHISDEHIAEAAGYRRRFVPYVAAACAVLVLIAGILLLADSFRPTDPSISMENPPVTTENTPTTPTEPLQQGTCGSTFVPEQVAVEHLLADPQYPALELFPVDQTDYDAWAQQHSRWSDSRRTLHYAPLGYADNLTGFWSKSIPLYLSDNAGTNAVYSPISLYHALAMTAQCAEGDSRLQLLNLLGAEDMEALAEQARLVFANHYENDGTHTSILANSVWLDDAYRFRQDTVSFLAENYYASVYQGALETPEMNIALKNWLNAQTGGLLEDSIANLGGMDERTAMMITSAIHYRCTWNDSFNPDRNTQGVFRAPVGEQTVTYMNGSANYSPYFWGEGFSATYLSLDDGNRMWLVLPDEGLTPEDLLQAGDALDMILNYSVYGEFNTKLPVYKDQASVTVNLTVPKFDISRDLDLMTGLEKLGITHATNPLLANFSGISDGDQQLYLGSANQGVRVAIDEKGLTGVAYTLIGVPGAGSPPEEEVDLVLDRPFLFVVESASGLPMFTGIVNNP